MHQIQEKKSTSSANVSISALDDSSMVDSITTEFFFDRDTYWSRDWNSTIPCARSSDDFSGNIEDENVCEGHTFVVKLGSVPMKRRSEKGQHNIVLMEDDVSKTPIALKSLAYLISAPELSTRVHRVYKYKKRAW